MKTMVIESGSLKTMVIEREGYIDTVTMLSDPGRNRIWMHIAREYEELSRTIDLEVQRGDWETWAHAIQGVE